MWLIKVKNRGNPQVDRVVRIIPSLRILEKTSVCETLLVVKVWNGMPINGTIPYSGKLWPALNLANQSPERFGEF